MHIPKLFQITNASIIEQLIKEIGLATLISKGTSFPVGTHIPLEIEVNAKGEKVLWGHVSKANPQWKEFSQDENVLAIFLSPFNHYISASWYNHPNASTWNYISIHISGKIKIVEGELLKEALLRLTNRYEDDRKKIKSFNDFHPSVQEQINGIVGFEISMDKIEAAFKMSQNRSDEDYKNIIKELRFKSDTIAHLVADVMQKHRS